jgi:hypothetical protein
MDGMEVLAIASVAAALVSGLMGWLSSRSFDARYGKPGTHRKP